MSYKKFNEQDFFTNEFYIREGVKFFYRQLSGSAGDTNIKLPDHFPNGNRSGSFYLDVFDRPHGDISANRLLSISYGFTTSSVHFSGAFSGSNQTPKTVMYRLFAKRLLGSEDRKFSVDGRIIDEAIFLSVARNQFKDGIVPNSTLMWYYPSGSSPGKENQTGTFNYGIVWDQKSKIQNEYSGPVSFLKDFRSDATHGIVFSKAGIVVIDPNMLPQNFPWSGSLDYENLARGLSGSNNNDLLWSIKNRFWYWECQNSQKTVSSFHTCTAEPDEFNYSSNPSFVAKSGEIYTSVSSSNASVYMTQILLLGQNGEVIAVAKTPGPIRKNPDIGVKIVARLNT